jgi:hypothetical protein
MFKSNLIAIDFDSIDVCEVKYLPPSFDGDVIFILPPINVDVSSTYGRSMDGTDKMCDGHLWCTTKTTNIQNNFGLSFRRSSYAGHLQCTNTYCEFVIICIALEVFTIVQVWIYYFIANHICLSIEKHIRQILMYNTYHKFGAYHISRCAQLMRWEQGTFPLSESSWLEK